MRNEGKRKEKAVRLSLAGGSNQVRGMRKWCQLVDFKSIGSSKWGRGRKIKGKGIAWGC